ncbi:HNH endonuclease [Paenibacillus sp. FSL H7-0716]|uniref:HNH nuclease domain-containing protein n=1 Tax=Paenibacillus odorifer TaxID=189426 RepID=A0AB36J3H4_9BACL|nr:HNH endonuclease [Paenibacillus odorifer]OME07536.1 hypothetical protein BSK60_31125 [Paenibacillus odorifer]OME11071.1 hypothetical protein BSK47_29635 [Paenibacillus odorifer]
MKNKFNIRGEITAIYVSSSEGIIETLIDTKSLEILNEFNGTFRASWNKNTKSYYVLGYDRSLGPSKNVMLHRYLTAAMDGLVVDHINHDTLDNRLVNLRVVTQSENVRNPDLKKRISKFPGVTWYENKGKWRAKRRVNGKSHHLGYFANWDDAVEAVKKFDVIISGPIAEQRQAL